LKIVASQPLGQLGRNESVPTEFAWHWLYHLPGLPLWGLILLSLVLVKGNRNRQAWLTVIPPLAVMLLWRMAARLLLMPPATAEMFGGFAVSLTTGLTMLWLLGHWLIARRRAITLVLALTVVLAVGAVSFVSTFGVDSAATVAGWWLLCHALCALSLLWAATLTAYSCGRIYRHRQFLTRMFFWMIGLSISMASVFAVVVVAMETGGPADVAGVLVVITLSALVMGGALGALVYLVNLPFMFLAKRSPLLRNRFFDAFRLAAAPRTVAVTRPLAAPSGDR
jgi:hypothetical protein